MTRAEQFSLFEFIKRVPEESQRGEHDNNQAWREQEGNERRCMRITIIKIRENKKETSEDVCALQ